VEKFYSTKFHIREDIEMSLGFNGEMIELSIPRRGVILQSGWKIKPHYDPIVSHKTFFMCMYVVVLVVVVYERVDAVLPHRLGKEMSTISVVV